MLNSDTWNHLTVCKQMSDIKLNHDSYIATFETILSSRNKGILVRLQILSTNNVFTKLIYLT